MGHLYACSLDSSNMNVHTVVISVNKVFASGRLQDATHSKALLSTNQQKNHEQNRA